MTQPQNSGPVNRSDWTVIHATRRLGIITALSALLSACNALGNPQSITWFTLNDLNQAGAENCAKPKQPVPLSLVIGQVDSNPFYNNTQIAYSRSDIARAYYQFAAWTERPAKRIAMLIEQRLANQQIFTSVSSQTAGVIGDLELNLSLGELYHDAAGVPESARITLRADLVDRKVRKMMARRTFVAVSRVEVPDAANAVRAMSQATSRVVQQLCDWAAMQVSDHLQNTTKKQ